MIIIKLMNKNSKVIINNNKKQYFKFHKINRNSKLTLAHNCLYLNKHLIMANKIIKDL